MTANELIQQLQAATGALSSGDTPITLMSMYADLRVELHQDAVDGKYYVELTPNKEWIEYNLSEPR